MKGHPSFVLNLSNGTLVHRYRRGHGSDQRRSIAVSLFAQLSAYSISLCLSNSDMHWLIHSFIKGNVHYYVFLFSDLDECESNSANNCKQLCINVPTSYFCDCRDGFKLNADGQSCDGETCLCIAELTVYVWGSYIVLLAVYLFFCFFWVSETCLFNKVRKQNTRKRKQTHGKQHCI